MNFIKANNILLAACPLCGKPVKLWEGTESIRCKISCTSCETEFLFKLGLDSQDVIKKWNTAFGLKTTNSKPVESFEYETTLCMEGPNQFKSVKYKPTCPHGYTDCVWDPAYIYATYPNWYKKLKGGALPTEVACESCPNGERYDDEDK